MDVFVARIRDDAFDAVHLPEVPGYDFGNFACHFFGGDARIFLSEVVEEGVECILTSEKKVVSLPFVSIGGLVRLFCPLKPFVRCTGILCSQPSKGLARFLYPDCGSMKKFVLFHGCAPSADIYLPHVPGHGNCGLRHGTYLDRSME